MPVDPPQLTHLQPHPEDQAWIPPPHLVRRRMVALVDRLIPQLPAPVRGLAATMARERLASLSDADTLALLFQVDELNSGLWAGPDEA